MSNKQRNKAKHEAVHYYDFNEREMLRTKPVLYKQLDVRTSIYDRMYKGGSAVRGYVLRLRIKGLTPQQAHEIAMFAWL